MKINEKTILGNFSILNVLFIKSNLTFLFFRECCFDLFPYCVIFCGQNSFMLLKKFVLHI